ncbi:MAG: heat-inducible transcription repressor HrcA [Chlorobi bacterium]|nr:heat-inducible transcription repressor HrcA [Chlorobiota bacterium]
MDKKVYIPTPSPGSLLNERDRGILARLIQLYILNANPVGSGSLSNFLQDKIKLSPATIRNVMSNLEELDLITHLHTSAGRIPTDKGYRFYVDSLMKKNSLSTVEIQTVNDRLGSLAADNDLYKEASKILGILSGCLGIVEIPHFADCAVQKFDVISLSSERILIVLALDSDKIKTLTLETTFDHDEKNIFYIKNFINERISGRTLKFIRDNFADLINDFNLKDSPLIRLFVDSVDTIFNVSPEGDKLHLAGSKKLLDNPEFEDLDRFRGIIELVENEEIIVHLLDKSELSAGDTKVFIGKELKNDMLDDYSLIVSPYSVGPANGSIGLIGPKRMNYSKMIALINHISEYITFKH